MLTELFRGKPNLADLPDWRDDPAYQAAKADEDRATARAATLDAEYRRLSIEANQGSEIIRTAPPGHPVHAVQYQSNLADEEAERARQVRERAERQAKANVQTAGEAAIRAAWPGVEAAIEQLAVQLTAFQALQMRVYERTDVRPIEISAAVGLNEADLRTFCANVRAALGLQR